MRGPLLSMNQELPTARPPKSGVLWSLALAHVLGIALIWVWWPSSSPTPSPTLHPLPSTNNAPSSP